MKKLLIKAIPFGIAFLFSATSQAQVSSQITDFYVGNTVTNDTFYFFIGIGEGHQYIFNQTNIGSTSVTYKCRKNNVTMAGGAYTNFCLYHNNDPGDPQSQCYTPPIMSSGNFITDPGEFNTLLADFVAGSTAGTSIVVYTFYDTANPNDSACITLVYNVTPVGIAESFVGELGEPFPNPANANVNIPFRNTSGNTALIITDALGKTVYTEVLVQESGTSSVDVNRFTAGMYFVELVSDEGMVARKKLIVQ